MQSSHARQYNNPEIRRDRRRDIAQKRARGNPMPNPKEHQRKYTAKKRKKMPAEYVRLKNNIPRVTKKGNIFYVLDSARGQYRIPRPLIISFVVIFACAILTVATQVYMSSLERQIASANTRLARIEASNETLLSQIGVHYTDDRIEEIAITRLGMIFPDQSQIIEIYVPLISNVEFNTAQHFLPSENYFWRDIRIFLSGMLDRVFGGN